MVSPGPYGVSVLRAMIVTPTCRPGVESLESFPWIVIVTGKGSLFVTSGGAIHWIVMAAEAEGIRKVST
jgi:hypothetical protein